MATRIEHLQGLLDSCTDLVQVISLDGHFIYTNPSWRNRFGYSEAEIAQLSFFDLLHDRDRTRSLAAFQALPMGQSGYDLETTLVTKDGSAIAVSGRISYQGETGQSPEIWSLWYSANPLATDATLSAAPQLFRSRAYYQAIVEDQTDLLHRYLPDGTLTFVNTAYSQLFATTPGAMIGQNLSEFMSPASYTRLMKRIASLTPGNPVINHQAELNTANGELQYFQWTNRGFFDPMGQLIELQAVGRDVTDYVKTNEALRKSKKLYRTLIRNFPNGAVALYNQDLQFVLVDGHGLSTLGLQPKQLQGKALQQVLPPDIYEIVAPHCRSTLTGHPSTFEIESGDRVFHINALPVKSKQGEIFAGIAVIQDITDRKQLERFLRQTNQELDTQIELRKLELEGTFNQLQTEIVRCKNVQEALQESEERYRSVVASLQEGIILQNATGHVWACNSSAEQILEIPAAQIAGHTLADHSWQVIHEDGSPCSIDSYPATITLKTGHSFSDVVLGVKKFNNQLTWLSVNTRPLWRKDETLPYAVVTSFSDITTRKQAEAELRKSEEQFRAIFENMGIGIAVITPPDFKFTQTNAALQEMLGYSAEELAELDYNAITHIEDLAIEQTLLQEGIQKKQPVYKLEKRYIHKTGKIVWGNLTVSLIYDAKEQLQFAIAVVKDITERQQTEVELLRQHRRSQLFAEITLKVRQSLQLQEILQITVTEIQKLLQADRVLIFQIHPDGSGTTVQEAVVPGYSKILGQNISDPCFQAEFVEQYRRGRIGAITDIDQAGLQSCHVQFLKQFEVRANLIVPILQSGRDEDRSPLLWGLLLAHQCSQPRQWAEPEVELLQQLANQVGIALAQSQLLESLRESEARFYGAFEHAAIGMALVSLEGRWLQVNPALCRILGYTESELLQTTVQAVTHPDDYAVDQSYMRQLLMGEIRFSQLEKRFVHKLGETVWIAFSMSLIGDAQEQPLYFVAQIQDITERKRAEEEVHKALEKEKELNGLKSRFVSMISHEFRTPLTTIQSASELLEYYEWPKEEKQERFQQIYTAVQHMTQLLEDVLLIGKAEAGKLQLKLEPLNLIEFCQTVITNLSLTTSNKHTFSFVNRSIPQPTYLDPKLLRQILNNLLTNGVKYSPDGGNIQLELEYQQGYVLLRVRDQGIGIPLEDRERLFETFYRATNVDTVQGTGLGLSIVKRCVDLHRGQIELESEVGQGTTFTVILPLHHPTAEEIHVKDFGD